LNNSGANLRKILTLKVALTKSYQHKSMRTMNMFLSVDLIVFMKTWWP